MIHFATGSQQGNSWFLFMNYYRTTRERERERTKRKDVLLIINIAFNNFYGSVPLIINVLLYETKYFHEKYFANYVANRMTNKNST